MKDSVTCLQTCSDNFWLLHVKRDVARLSYVEMNEKIQLEIQKLKSNTKDESWNWSVHLFYKKFSCNNIFPKIYFFFNINLFYHMSYYTSILKKIINNIETLTFQHSLFWPTHDDFSTLQICCFAKCNKFIYMY